MHFISAGWDGGHGSSAGGMRRDSVDPQHPCPELMAFEAVGCLPGLTSEYGKEEYGFSACHLQCRSLNPHFRLGFPWELNL